jgi:hypothetical protein
MKGMNHSTLLKGGLCFIEIRREDVNRGLELVPMIGVWQDGGKFWDAFEITNFLACSKTVRPNRGRSAGNQLIL